MVATLALTGYKDYFAEVIRRNRAEAANTNWHDGKIAVVV